MATVDEFAADEGDEAGAVPTGASDELVEEVVVCVAAGFAFAAVPDDVAGLDVDAAVAAPVEGTPPATAAGAALLPPPPPPQAPSSKDATNAQTLCRTKKTILLLISLTVLRESLRREHRIDVTARIW